jgi:group I intron endonuclease
MADTTIEHRVWHIYKVTCLVNGKSYIGMTSDTVKQRWSNHVCQATRGNKRSILHRAIRKYGRERFAITVLRAASSLDEASQAEQFLIIEHGTLLPAGYNVTHGGMGTVGLRKPHSALTRGKIGAANRTRIITADTRLKMSAAKQGKPLSAEHREKLSAAHKGIPRTPEWRANQSAAVTGRKFPRRSIALLNASKVGGWRSTTGHRGITRDGSKWVARLGLDRKRVHLGTFVTKEQAIEAYNSAVKDRLSTLTELIGGN